MLDQKFFFLTHIKYAKANKITCLLYKYTKKSHVLSYLNDKDISDKKKMTKIKTLEKCFNKCYYSKYFHYFVF